MLDMYEQVVYLAINLWTTGVSLLMNRPSWYFCNSWRRSSRLQQSSILIEVSINSRKHKNVDPCSASSLNCDRSKTLIFYSRSSSWLSRESRFILNLDSMQQLSYKIVWSIRQITKASVKKLRFQRFSSYLETSHRSYHSQGWNR